MWQWLAPRLWEARGRRPVTSCLMSFPPSGSPVGCGAPISDPGQAGDRKSQDRLRAHPCPPFPSRLPLPLHVAPAPDAAGQRGLCPPDTGEGARPLFSRPRAFLPQLPREGAPGPLQVLSFHPNIWNSLGTWVDKREERERSGRWAGICRNSCENRAPVLGNSPHSLARGAGRETRPLRT